MNKQQKLEIKAKWLEELRSGNHKQVQCTLKGIKEDGSVGYCCLGVLREKVQGIPIKAVKVNSENLGGGAQRHYTGIRNIIGDADLIDDLIYLNDEKRYSFKKIASRIEKEWKIE